MALVVVEATMTKFDLQDHWGAQEVTVEVLLPEAGGGGCSP